MFPILKYIVNELHLHLIIYLHIKCFFVYSVWCMYVDTRDNCLFRFSISTVNNILDKKKNKKQRENWSQNVHTEHRKTLKSIYLSVWFYFFIKCLESRLHSQLNRNEYFTRFVTNEWEFRSIKWYCRSTSDKRI